MRKRSPRDPTARRYLWRLRPYFRQVAGLLVLGSVSGFIMNVAVVLPPLLLGHAINVVLALRNGRADTRQVAVAALLVVLGTGATEIPRIGKRYWLGVARSRVVASVRFDALRGALAHQGDPTKALPVGDIMARVVGDVEVLGTGVGEVVTETWDTILFTVSLSVAMLVLSPTLSALALLPVPFVLWLAAYSGTKIRHRTTRARESEAALTRALREQIGLLRVLRVFGRTPSAAQHIESLAQDQARAELFAIHLDEVLAAFYGASLSAGAVFIIWLGGRDVASGSMSLGTLVALLTLFVRLTNRAPRIPQMANRVQAGGAAFRRIEPLLVAPSQWNAEPRWSSFRATALPGAAIARETNGDVRREPGPVAVRLDRVIFAHHGAPSPNLNSLSLEIASGAFVAVTGPVGSGKSTLARLVAGLLVPDAGTVFLAGLDTAAMDPTLRATLVGYLDQEPQLFSGSVRDNITLWCDESSRSANPSTLANSTRIAALDRDLAAMPEGLATQIGELGVRVSGGQRQRIGLARAHCAPSAPPGLLVLDDPFSGADARTELRIARELRRVFGPSAPLEKRSTILLVSHRLASFPLADLVVVLEENTVREIGSHDELMKARGTYSRIFHAQHQLDSSSVGSRAPQ